MPDRPNAMRVISIRANARADQMLAELTDRFVAMTDAQRLAWCDRLEAEAHTSQTHDDLDRVQMLQLASEIVLANAAARQAGGRHA